MDEERIKEYLEHQKQVEYFWRDIEKEKTRSKLFDVVGDIIADIEKREKGLWYAGPSSIILNPELILEICIISYNMGVRKYLKEIKEEVEKWVEKENINYIKGVDVYWQDTLPGKGNLGIRRD